MAYPDSNEITTLAQVKSLNNITVSTADTFITAMIPVIGRAIEYWCRRRFCKSNWIQWYPVQRELILDEYPINNVLLVGVPYTAFTITDTNNLYNFNISQANSRNLNIVSKLSVTNTQTFAVTDFLFSTYTTIGALKTQVENDISGVTFTYGTLPTTITIADQNTLTLRACSGKTVYFGANYFDQFSNAGVGDIYRISDTSDRLLLNPSYANSSVFNRYYDQFATGYGNIDSYAPQDWYNPDDIMVVWNAGYTTAEMPQELSLVATAMINDLIALFDVLGDGSYKGIYQSERLGDYEYRLWDVSGGASNEDAMIADLIQHKYAIALDRFRKKSI
jgi:hypothetical protein